VSAALSEVRRTTGNDTLTVLLAQRHVFLQRQLQGDRAGGGGDRGAAIPSTEPRPPRVATSPPAPVSNVGVSVASIRAGAAVSAIARCHPTVQRVHASPSLPSLARNRSVAVVVDPRKVQTMKTDTGAVPEASARLQGRSGKPAVGRPSTGAPRSVQRASDVKVAYTDPAPPGNTPVRIEIRGSFLADQSKIQSAGHPGPQEARHIVPQGLINRALEGQFGGKTADFFLRHHNYQPHPNGFREAVRRIVELELQYQHARLNKDGPAGTSWMPANGPFPSSHANANRNYWLGSKAENQGINHQVRSLRSRVEAAWTHAGLPNDAALVDVNGAAFQGFKNATDADNAQWLSWEFDPPPGKTKADYKQMGEAWAGFTSDWFKGNALARLAFCPSSYLGTGEVPWDLAYKPTVINWQKYSTAP